MRHHVEKAASVTESSFFSDFEVFGKPKTRKKTYTHGQYAECSDRGTYGYAHHKRGDVFDDDHHAPLNPDAYLKLRVEPQMRFYQSRVPAYYRVRTISEILIVLGSLSGTLMAFLGVDNWTAVVTATTTAVTAWMAFSGTSRKLTRYSNTVSKVMDILLWWKHMTPIEKSSVTNVNQVGPTRDRDSYTYRGDNYLCFACYNRSECTRRQLVMICEDLFEKERDSWQSTSITIRLLGKAMAGDASSSEGTEAAAGAQILAGS
jgi:hypothetical protein